MVKKHNRQTGQESDVRRKLGKIVFCSDCGGIVDVPDDEDDDCVRDD
jgi:hypothetical protein